MPGNQIKQKQRLSFFFQENGGHGRGVPNNFVITLSVVYKGCMILETILEHRWIGIKKDSLIPGWHTESILSELSDIILEEILFIYTLGYT